jgi:hypothetical protein
MLPQSYRQTIEAKSKGSVIMQRWLNFVAAQLDPERRDQGFKTGEATALTRMRIFQAETPHGHLVRVLAALLPTAQ